MDSHAATNTGRENTVSFGVREHLYRAQKRVEMPLSARNQLPGKVQEVRLGEVMAHVVVRVGKNIIESVITRTSAEELALKKGDAVTVVIKSTEVMLQKD